MILRSLFLGNSQGKTAWQLLRERFIGVTSIANPLGLQLGDILEIHKADTHSFRCESIMYYRNESHREQWLRLGIKDLSSGTVFLLEIAPDGNESYFYTLFRLVDEIEWDDDLIEIIKHENILRFTHENTIKDYEKDFVVNCVIEIVRKDKRHRLRSVVSANYVFQSSNSEEEYLSIDVVRDQNRITFYRGEKLEASDITAYGTK
jgi:hypothetical protein